MWHAFQMMFVIGVVGFLAVEGAAVVGLCVKVVRLEEELERGKRHGNHRESD